LTHVTRLTRAGQKGEPELTRTWSESSAKLGVLFLVLNFIRILKQNLNQNSVHLAQRASLELAKFNSPDKITNRKEPTETNRITNLNLTMSENEDEVDPNAQISNQSRT